MDIRKKFFSIVGVLALTMSMTAGIASTQEATGDGIGVTFVVACSANNAGTSSATIGNSNGTTDSVAFSLYDAGATEQTGTTSTADDAFRVNVDLSCLAQGSGFSLTASITDFSAVDETLSFPGSHFQLTSDNVWTVTGTADTPANNVDEPAAAVSFAGDGPTYTSGSIAHSSATTNSSMYMDFTGELVGLDGEIAAGEYSAEITVTLNTGTAP